MVSWSSLVNIMLKPGLRICPQKIQLCQKFLTIPVQRWACRVCPLTKVGGLTAVEGVWLNGGYISVARWCSMMNQVWSL